VEAYESAHKQSPARENDPNGGVVDVYFWRRLLGANVRFAPVRHLTSSKLLR
jgi:hypothetical protein